ncbi:hypothetical protein, partial [Enterobacter asburiae]
ADAYYGVHTLRAIENFYISNNKISDIPEFVRGKSDRSHVVLRAKELSGMIVFLRPLGLRLADAYYGVHTLRAIENFYISNNKISD